MPILENKNGEVYIDYQLSQELKDLITVDFANMIVREIRTIFKNIENEDSLLGIFVMNSSAGGVFDAFKNTCEELNLPQLLDASKLPWYDYDFFMDQVLTVVGELYYGKEIYEKLCDEYVEKWNQEAEESIDGDLLQLDSAIGYFGLVHILKSLGSSLSEIESKFLHLFIEETTKDLSKEQIDELSSKIMKDLFFKKDEENENKEKNQ